MIIMAGMRTDVPAFYSEWLVNRVHEGFALVRNPYNPDSVTRYELNPDVVDCLFFCTKNPVPMFPRLKEVAGFRWFWHVTLTPYGKDLEPNVPDKRLIVEQFRKLSIEVNRHNANFGKAHINPQQIQHDSNTRLASETATPDDLKLIEKYDAVHWRYDPIVITEKYTVEQHIKSFEVMAELLAGYTHSCIVSFIDLYDNVKRNFPEASAVTPEEQEILIKAFAEIGQKYGITIRMCAEDPQMSKFGADCNGCSTTEILNKALGLSDIGLTLAPPKKKFARAECNCILGGDIGAYSNCPHLCKYCYANHDKVKVLRNHKSHDPTSPFIVGNSRNSDIIRPAKQESWIIPAPESQLLLPL